MSNHKNFMSSRIQDMYEKRQMILAVPYAEKDAAVKAGALWHRDHKVWFVPAKADISLFEKWNPAKSGIHSNGNTASVQGCFEDLLIEMGLVLNGEIIDDGKWHYVPVNTNKKKNLAGGYQFSMTGGKHGQPFGAAVNRHLGDFRTWTEQHKEMSPEKIAQIRAENIIRDEAHQLEVAGRQNEAAKHARLIYEAGNNAQDHGYAIKKGINVLTTKQIAGRELKKYPEFYGDSGNSIIKDDEAYLIVPMFNITNDLRAVQAISSSGVVKAFMRGGQKKGMMHIIGGESIEDIVQCHTAVAYVEGYATGASFYEATGIPVIVCFDAHNLEQVVLQTANKFPKNFPQIIAADNDQFFAERAVAFLEEQLAVKSVFKAENSIEIKAGIHIKRKVNLGGFAFDGNWHELGKGSYRVVVDSDKNGSLVQKISIEIESPQGKSKAVYVNTGIESGKIAAEFIRSSGLNGTLVFPEFKSLSRKPTDWNDLYKTGGISAIHDLLTGEYNIHCNVMDHSLFKTKQSVNSISR